MSNLRTTAVFLVTTGLAACLQHTFHGGGRVFAPSLSLNVRGVSINYELTLRDASAARPVVVLLHGFGASLQSWYDVTPALQSRYSILRIDLKGHGFSGKPRAGTYSLEEQAAIVADLLINLRLKDVILVGHSYGGAVAFLTYLKLRSSDTGSRVKGLVFIDSATYPQSPPFFVANLRNPITRFVSTQFTSPDWRARFVLERIFAVKSQVTNDRVERYGFFFGMAGSNEALGRAAAHVLPERADELVRQLRTVEVPTLIIWGEHDPVISLRNAHRLHQDIVGSELRIIASTGHVPHEERPSETLAVLFPFLDQVR